MNVFMHWAKTILTCAALLGISLSAAAYELSFLTGSGAQAKAMKDGDYQLAIERLELRVANRNGGSPEQLTNLCTAYVAIGELDKAHEVCDRAVEANGEYLGTAFNSRGVLHALMGDFVAAHDDFESAANARNYPRASKTAYPYQDIRDARQLAASNHVISDRRWAMIDKEADTEELAAGASE